MNTYQGEHNVLALLDLFMDRTAQAEAKLRAVCSLLEVTGCDCECGHDSEGHDEDCERCLGCRIEEAIRKEAEK